MSPIKLLLVTNRYPANRDDGASPFVADFVAGLKHRQVDCTVLTPYHHAEGFDNDDSVVRFGWGEGTLTIGSLPLLRPSSWLKIAAYMRRGYAEAVRLHRERKFDFCLALWAAPSGLFARRLNRDFGLPYAVWCLGSDIHTYARLPVLGNLIVETLTASDRVYSDGYDLAQAAERLSGCRCHFLPSLRRISTPVPDTDGRRERLLVCPGRVEQSKGVFDLLEAFRSIAPKFNSWSLYFVGDGRARRRLEQRIETYGLAKQVKALGFLPAGEMFRLINLSAAVVIPTRSDSLPLTFGEAMQLRRPVIVTDVGDLKYFTEKYGVGVVVPPASPSRLADALNRFITEKRDYTSGFSECVGELDVDSAVERFVCWLTNHLAHREKARETASC